MVASTRARKNVIHANYATMGKNELAKQLVDRISEQITLIEQLQAQAIKREARIKELKKKKLSSTSAGELFRLAVVRLLHLG